METWNSAFLSRCKTGVRLPVKLYRDLGLLLEVNRAVTARPFCDRQVVPTEGGLRGSLLHAVPVP